MNPSYDCIVNLPGAPVREIALMTVDTDAVVGAEMARLADRWPGVETIAPYDGERPVSVLAGPWLGLPMEALESADLAA